MDPRESVEALAQGKIGSELGRRGRDPREESRADIIDALPAAVQSLVTLAIHSSNERIKLDSAKYIIERGLGPVSRSNGRGDNNPIQELIDELLDNPPVDG